MEAIRALVTTRGAALHAIRAPVSTSSPTSATSSLHVSGGNPPTRQYARADTPVHSLLHEAGHLIVLPPERRAQVHTDATDSIAEEDATCYLQIVLADELPGVGRARLMADMDAWGYSFRLGSTAAWFAEDAENARQWLVEHALLDMQGRPIFN